MSDAATAAPFPRRSLVHPLADFWLLGGLSLVTLAVCWGLTYFADMELTGTVAWWAYYAAFAINYPHFAYSYQLFYSGFARRAIDTEVSTVNRWRLLIAGIIVPAFLIGYFYETYMLRSRTALSIGIMSMFFFVGWHYVKQAYGVLITLSVYKGVFYANWQKRCLYGNSYVVWAYAWLSVNTHIRSHDYYGMSYYTLNLPEEWTEWAGVAALISGMLALFAVLKTSWVDRKGISWNGVVGYTTAIYVWVMAPYVNAAFFYFIPLFHSLQYLPFVFKFKKSELTGGAAPEKPQRWTRGFLLATFVFGGVLLGGTFMHFLPQHIDTLHHGFDPLIPKNYFLIATLLFINIHHYFIDSAFWRRDNKDVQQHLFRA